MNDEIKMAIEEVLDDIQGNSTYKDLFKKLLMNVLQENVDDNVLVTDLLRLLESNNTLEDDVEEVQLNGPSTT